MQRRIHGILLYLSLHFQMQMHLFKSNITTKFQRCCNFHLLDNASYIILHYTYMPNVLLFCLLKMGGLFMYPKMCYLFIKVWIIGYILFSYAQLCGLLCLQLLTFNETKIVTIAQDLYTNQILYC